MKERLVCVTEISWDWSISADATALSPPVAVATAVALWLAVTSKVPIMF